MPKHSSLSMHGWRTLILWSASCLLAVTGTGQCAEALVFKRIDTAVLPSALTISPDGKYVYGSAPQAGRICVIDTVTGAVVKTLEVPGVSAVLSRRGRVFAASTEAGTIRVFDVAHEWQQTAEIAVGEKRVLFLSAPGEAHFNDVLLACCEVGNQTKVLSVDVKSGVAKQLFNETGGCRALVDCAGRMVLFQGNRLEGFLYKPCLEGTKIRIYPFAGRNDSHAFGIAAPLSQLHPGSVWTASGLAFLGFPGVPLAASKGRHCVFQDALDASYYLDLETGRLVARPPDSSGQELWSLPALETDGPAAGQGIKGSAVRETPSKPKPSAMDMASVAEAGSHETAVVAATIDGKLYIYAITPWNLLAGSGPKPQAVPAAPAAARAVPARPETSMPVAAFQPVEANPIPSMFTLSEDGSRLFVATRAQDTVLVYETDTGRLLNRIDVTDPAWIVSRGKRLFVANGATGEITEFEYAGSPRHTASYTLGSAGVAHFDAPGGEHFEGKFLVSFPSSHISANPDAWSYVLLDTKTKTCAPVSIPMQARLAEGPALFSYDGKHVSVQGLYNGSFVTIPLSSFLNFQSSASPSITDLVTSGQLAQQLQAAPFWVSPGTLLYGSPAKKIEIAGAQHLFPDLQAPRLYALQNQNIRTLTLDVRVKELAITPVSGLPGEGYRQLSKSPGLSPLAVSRGNQVVFYALCKDPSDSRLGMYRGVMPLPKGEIVEEQKPGALPKPREDEIKFSTVTMKDEPGALAVSEDGRVLYVTNPAAGSLLALDTKTEKVLGRAELPDPGELLVRGALVMGVSRSRGAVYAFDGGDGLKLKGSVSLGEAGSITLTAAGGKFFNGQVFACLDRRGNDKVRETRPFRFNTGNLAIPAVPILTGDKDKEIFSLCASYDGTRLVQVRHFDTRTYLIPPGTGELVAQWGNSTFSGGGSGPAEKLLLDAGPSLVWTGGKSVWYGLPPRRIVSEKSVLAVGDQCRGLVYVLTEDGRVRALTQDSRLAQAVEKRLNPPPECNPQSFLLYLQSLPQSRQTEEVQWRVPATAVTLDGLLHLYVVGMDSTGALATLYHGVACEIPIPKDEAANAAPVALSRDADTIHFRPMYLDIEPKGLTLSADGRTLHVVNDEADRIITLDTVSGKEEAVISTPSPICAIQSGKQLYVANCGRGTISVFAGDDKWALRDQLLVGATDVLSVVEIPAGPYAGRLLATIARGRGKRSLLVVDPKKDTNTVLNEEIHGEYGTIAISSDGEKVVALTGDQLSSVWTLDELMTKQKSLPADRNVIGCSERIYQPAGSPLWLADTKVLLGRALTPLDFGVEARIVEVTGEKSFLRLGSGKMIAHNLDLEARETGSCAIDGLPEIAKPGQAPARETAISNLDRIPRYGRQAAAVRRGDMVSCYVIAPGANGLKCLYRGAGRFPTDRVASPAAAQPDGRPPTLPEQVVAGQKLECSIASADDGNAKFALVSGPDGMQVTPAGVLSWTPTAGQAGVNAIKIRITTPTEVKFNRFSLTVGETGTGRNATGAKGNAPNLFLENRSPIMFPAARNDGLWVVDGRNAILMPGTEAVSTSRLFLPCEANAAQDRGDYLVVAGTSKVMLVGKPAGQVLKSADMACTRINDLVLDPNRTSTYVATYDEPAQSGMDSKLGTSIVKCLDEKTGQVTPLTAVLATKLAIHPTGAYLYGALSAKSYDQHTLIGAFGSGYTFSTTLQVDVLVAYNLTGMGAESRSVNTDPGIEVLHLRALPDGSGVGCLSRRAGEVGSANVSGTVIPIFDAQNVAKCQRTLRVGNPPRDFAFHPSLPLAMATDGAVLKFFDAQTGGELPSRLGATLLPLRSIARVAFIPPGKAIAVVGGDAVGRTVLLRLPLNLTPEEQQRLGQPIKVQTFAFAPTRHLSPKVLTALQNKRGKDEVASVDIPKLCAPSVVVIRCDGGHGTGFFVGDDGYVLTCAHVVQGKDKVNVSYLRNPAEFPLTDKSQLTAVAEVLGADLKEDLALLKLTVEKPQGRSLILAEAGEVKTGARIYIVGNPGLGSEVLTHTMTAGIVANAQCRLEGGDYIQTDASVSPGSSGSPMLDIHGNVVGIVAAKGDIQAAGFAIPGERIVTFLKKFLE